MIPGNIHDLVVMGMANGCLVLGLDHQQFGGISVLFYMVLIFYSQFEFPHFYEHHRNFFKKMIAFLQLYQIGLFESGLAKDQQDFSANHVNLIQ